MDDEVIGFEKQPYKDREGKHAPEFPASGGQERSSLKPEQNAVRHQDIGPPGEAIKPGVDRLYFAEEAIFRDY